MNKRSGLKHKRTERKRKAKAYRKGSKSKTMKGKKDFTTKKSSKVFNRRKHYQKHAKGSRVNRRPYQKNGGGKTHHGPVSTAMGHFHIDPHVNLGPTPHMFRGIQWFE